MKVAVCAFVRNEERHIAEWIAYQSIVGFDSIVLYDNMSADATASIATSAGKISDVRVVPWDATHKLAQISAYQNCLDQFSSEFDWIAFLDADEFFASQSYESVKYIITKNAGSPAIAINWAIFGSSGLVSYPKDLCISSFTRRAPASLGTNRHYKSIINTRALRSIKSVHGACASEGCVRPDGSGFDDQKPGKMFDAANFDICQINHYFVKSRAHWSEKLSRGYRDGTKRSLDDFERYDHNQIEDLSAARLAPKVRDLMDRYRLRS